ncbi:MAG: efflux RND transporter periplasmic adaptor subunit [Steroidobacteraceae bacterium]|jgi:HlyD family secretion protein|nr:efflux RND transporter periplasmic adaptor subunit [Steroidobacteraceae bacterium]
MDDSTRPDPNSRAALDAFLGRTSASPRVRRLRLIVILAGTLLLAALLYAWLARGDDGAPAYATAAVERGDLRVRVSATGNLQPTNEVEVGSELSGLVAEVRVDNNDRVAKGQVLARIDTSRLADAIAQSRAALESAEAGVAQAEATAQQATATLARLEEVRQLSGGKVPSATEMDTARAEQARAQAAVRSAKAAVAQARAQLSSDETQFAKAAIRSPVTGVVLSRQVDPGQTVAASFNAPVLFLIAEDLARMRLEVRVDEADVGQVGAGQAARFQVDAFPGRTFPARVERVDLGANASGTTAAATASAVASANSVVAYAAVLAVDNRDGSLRPGMTATAEIVTSEKRGVLLVPNAALRFDPEATGAAGARSGVTRVLLPGPMRGGNRPARDVTIGRGSEQRVHVLGDDGRPVPIAVRTGDSDGRLTEVTGEGLREGLAVITGRLATAGGSRR